MAVKKVVKKVLDSILGSTEIVEFEPTETVEVACTNCSDSGLQCSVCSPVFEDTFGK